MNNFSNIDLTRLCLIICLESINIDKTNKILRNINQEFKNSNTFFPYNDLKKQSQPSDKKSLSNIQNILTVINKKDAKNKIIHILEYYSRANRYSKNKSNSIFFKYIDRFTYKYIKYYKKNNKLGNISLIYLYLLYKTLKTNKTFYIYKHLKIQIDKLKN